jgi:hypothetical protein
MPPLERPRENNYGNPKISVCVVMLAALTHAFISNQLVTIIGDAFMLG